MAMDEQVSFQAVCHLFEHLAKISKKDAKKHKLQLFIDVFTVVVVHRYLYPYDRNGDCRTRTCSRWFG